MEPIEFTNNRDNSLRETFGFFYIFFEELVYLVLCDEQALRAYRTGWKDELLSQDLDELAAIDKFLNIFFNNNIYAEGAPPEQSGIYILILGKLMTIYTEAKTQLSKISKAKKTDTTSRVRKYFYAKHYLLDAIIKYNKQYSADTRLGFNELVLNHMYRLLQYLFGIEIPENIVDIPNFASVEFINDTIQESAAGFSLRIEFNQLELHHMVQQFMIMNDAQLGAISSNPLFETTRRKINHTDMKHIFLINTEPFNKLITCDRMYVDVELGNLTFPPSSYPNVGQIRILENPYDIAHNFELWFNIITQVDPLTSSNILLLYHGSSISE